MERTMYPLVGHDSIARMQPVATNRSRLPSSMDPYYNRRPLPPSVDEYRGSALEIMSTFNQIPVNPFVRRAA